jgi:precorrin-2 dehydrogenase/sirohydrochlorin ferrochelatase
VSGSSPRHYMACLDLRGRDCLVVGGGRVATEKVHGLLDCEARVTIVAPQVDDDLRRLPVRIDRRPFRRSDVVGRFLVIAATDDRAVNMEVSSAAAERATLCNVADDPELCSFILPAIVRRDPILVGVSTGGASPALAQRIRADVADLIGPEHAALADQLAALRPWAKRELPSYEARRDYFQALVAEALG